MKNESYYKYWGKARPASDDGVQYHLLPYHCLDVAAVGMEYIALHESLSNYFCEQLLCDKNSWLNWAAFWVALYDLGKLSEAFQSQKTERVKYRQGKKYKKCCGAN